MNDENEREKEGSGEDEVELVGSVGAPSLC